MSIPRPVKDEISTLFYHLNFDETQVLLVGRECRQLVPGFPCGGKKNFRFFELDAEGKGIEPHSFDVLIISLYIDAKSSERNGARSFSQNIDHWIEFLKPDGVLAVACDNLLGIQFWNGMVDPYSRWIFGGICNSREQGTDHCLSYFYLIEIFKKHGFQKVVENFVYSGIGLPLTVISRELFDRFPRIAAELAISPACDPPDTYRMRLFPENLASLNLARAGYLPFFANAFLFFSSRIPNSAIFRRIYQSHQSGGELAWHYAISRKCPAQTVFIQAGGDESKLLVRKSVLGGQLKKMDGNDSWECLGNFTGKILWCGGTSPVEVNGATGQSLRTQLSLLCYNENWDMFFGSLLHFIRWSFEKWGRPLLGKSIDAVLGNAYIPEKAANFQGHYILFDLEWQIENPVNESWFIFRNIFNLIKDALLFSNSAPFQSFFDLYHLLCNSCSIEPSFERDLEWEAEFQSLISNQSDLEHHRAELRKFFLSPFGEAHYHKDPKSFHLQTEIQTLREENAALRGESSTLRGEIAALREENAALRMELRKPFRQVFREKVKRKFQKILTHT